MSASVYPRSVAPDNLLHGTDSDASAEGLQPAADIETHDPKAVPNWLKNASLLWRRRRALAHTAWIAFVLAVAIAFLLPKQYESSARILPPSNSTGGAAMLAALAGRGGGSLGGLNALASDFLGGGNAPLFIDLLRSGSVSGHLIDRFNLQSVYHKRYRSDTAKRLARLTSIVDDKKSGVITLTVTDTDPVRARDIAQCYLDELNLLVNRTNTSSAHQERLFIEQRLTGVRADLEKAQQQLSEFSSTHATVDIKEQARSMVDAAARLQTELIVEQASLDSLRQIYGDRNVRVRSAQARIGELQTQIDKMGGSSTPLPAGDEGSDGTSSSEVEGKDSSPSLRQLPRLAVPYANLYREVQIQESVYQLLTQQYELARIQEAKDTPVVSVIDAPGIPEKKSFPPRILLSLLLTAVSISVAAAVLLAQEQWQRIPQSDPFRVLLQQISGCIPRWPMSWQRQAGSER